MFGVVPRSMWEKIYPPLRDNLCNCACRSMLIETDGHLVLIDTGIGDKQDASYLKHYHLNGDDNLLNSLARVGFKPEDVTDVIHTHLHFDHCGGTIRRDDTGKLVPTFPNANLWVSKTQWDWAMHPNRREAPAFLDENLQPILESGNLKFIEKEKSTIPGIELREFNGHTHGLIAVIVHHPKAKIAFTGDLMPAEPYLRSSFISAYDVEPLRTLQENKAFLQEAIEKKYYLFWQHDIHYELAEIHNTEKGIRIKARLSISELLG